METAARIQTFIQDAKWLPGIPEVTLALLDAVESEGASVQEIARLIESDPSLSVRILRVANSPFYGQRGQVSTIPRAVLLLGSKTIRSLALAIWTHALRTGARDPGELPLMVVLCAHGLATGVLAAMLMERIRPGLGEDAFMAGLLHDLGRLALLGAPGLGYRAKVLEAASHGGLRAEPLERELLGFEHGELGAALLASWKLPSFLADAARRHHEEGLAPSEPFLLEAVVLGDGLATRLGYNLALGAERTLRMDFAPCFGWPPEGPSQTFLEAAIGRIAMLSEALD